VIPEFSQKFFKKVSPEPVCIFFGTPVIFQHGWNRADTHNLLF